MVLGIDHIAISAGRLQEGVEYVEAALGVPLEAGGRHLRFGTHNRLLNLGELYLEVIAIDPQAEAPFAPRWSPQTHQLDLPHRGDGPGFEGCAAPNGPQCGGQPRRSELVDKRTRDRYFAA